MAKSSPGIYIVGLNIDKQDGHRGRREGHLLRLVHGVYMDADANPVEIFREYGFRLALFKHRTAALSHATAWHQRPIEVKEGRKLLAVNVFIGGDYPRKDEFGGDLRDPGIVGDKIYPDFRVIQTAETPDTSDPTHYTLEKFTDGIGTFEMYCATPELCILQMMESTKKHPEKHIADELLPAAAKVLLDRHGGDPYAVLPAVDAIAKKADKERMYERFVKIMLPLMRAQV
ncbi:MAG: hypothetical protein EPN79_15715 [Burkholderiaceae bacterium]|nr:MAG: hypothetical protein EPN79_15715 [Burkholderiaceae bacterium]